LHKLRKSEQRSKEVVKDLQFYPLQTDSFRGTPTSPISKFLQLPIPVKKQSCFIS